MRTILINGVVHQLHEAGDPVLSHDEIMEQARELNRNIAERHREALVDFLLNLGLEEKSGYGHPTAEDVADDLIANGWIDGA